MHNVLKKLIFGLDEYEKVRIDERFKQIDLILNNITLNKREDFEILEECLYKIKEQLRVKSSNLNKTISDTTNSLRKSDVNRILEKLEQIKYEFIGMAFDNISKKEEIEESEKPTVKKEEPKLQPISETKIEKPTPKPVEPIPSQKIKEEQEDSLDSLLSNINEPEEERKENIIDEEKTNKPIAKEEPKPIVKEESKPKNNLDEEKKETQTPKMDVPTLPYEVYRAESIIAYFESNSIAKGELVIKPFSDKKIEDLNESQISYIVIFSKVFASILFELTNSHGTNLFWDYKKNSVRIVPRFENDDINFKMVSEKTTEGFLDQIRKKLLNDMGKKNDTKEEENEKSDEMPVKNPNVESVEGQLIVQPKKEIPKLTKDSSKRGDFLINRLKRMP